MSARSPSSVLRHRFEVIRILPRSAPPHVRRHRDHSFWITAKRLLQRDARGTPEILQRAESVLRTRVRGTRSLSPRGQVPRAGRPPAHWFRGLNGGTRPPARPKGRSRRWPLPFLPVPGQGMPGYARCSGATGSTNTNHIARAHGSERSCHTPARASFCCRPRVGQLYSAGPADGFPNKHCSAANDYGDADGAHGRSFAPRPSPAESE